MARWFWRLFLVLEGLLLALFCIGYAAAFLHPRHFWGAAMVAIGLPYLSLALLPSLAVLLAARRWRLAAFHLVFVLLALVRFLPPLPGALLREAGAEDLVVMSFNVPEGALMGRSIEERQAAVVELVRAERPHLIGLQETAIYVHGDEPHWAHVRTLRRDLGYRYEWPAKNGEISLPVLGLVPIVEQEFISLLNEGPRHHASYLIRTVFTWQGREVAHYNLHLQSYRTDGKPNPEVSRVTPRSWMNRLLASRDAYLARAEEAEKVRALLDAETRPFLVSGDFNDTPHSWVYRRIARGLTDAFRAAGAGWGATWHARLPLVRIDFVLASPAWEVVSAHVPAVLISDHRPLVARLRLRQAAVAGVSGRPASGP